MYVIHHPKFTLYCNKTEERRQKIETTAGLSDFEASAQIHELLDHICLENFSIMLAPF